MYVEQVLIFVSYETVTGNVINVVDLVVSPYSYERIAAKFSTTGL